jgi:tripartite-type tricarboxylate transporter receptor subunit TctC
MPKPFIDRLQREIAAIMREPSFRQKQLIERTLEPIADTPEEFTRFLKEDRLVSERVVKASGLQPQ